MRTILFYLPLDGQHEEQEVTVEEIEAAGFKGLVEYWHHKVSAYPEATLLQFYREVVDRSKVMQGTPSGAESYLALLDIAYGVTNRYFPRRAGTYQYSLVLTGPVANENLTVVCRDYPPEGGDSV